MLSINRQQFDTQEDIRIEIQQCVSFDICFEQDEREFDNNHTSYNRERHSNDIHCT